MSKLGQVTLAFITVGLLFHYSSTAIQAQAPTPKSSSTGCTIKVEPQNFPANESAQVTINSNIDCFQENVDYSVIVCPEPNGDPAGFSSCSVANARQTPGHRVERTDSKTLVSYLKLLEGYGPSREKKHPQTWKLVVCIGAISEDCFKKNAFASAGIIMTPKTNTPTPTPPGNLPRIDPDAQSQCVYQKGSPITIAKVSNLDTAKTYSGWWDEGLFKGSVIDDFKPSGTEASVEVPSKATSDKSTGKHRFCLDLQGVRRGGGDNCITFRFTPGPPTGDLSCSTLTRGPANECTEDIEKACLKEGAVCQGGRCVEQSSAAGISCPIGSDPIIEDGDTAEVKKAKREQQHGIMTAIGCMPTEPQALISGFFRIALGVGGAIALLLMIAGVFQFIGSGGNPDAVTAAHERFTSAIIGILVIVFAVFLLQVIGVDILNIPGFATVP